MMSTNVLTAVCLAACLVCGGNAFARTSTPTATSASSQTASSKTALIDINSASKDELKGLKGVGDKRADDIIKGRPYKGKDELVQKKIISQGVYNSVKDKIIAKQR